MKKKIILSLCLVLSSISFAAQGMKVTETLTEMLTQTHYPSLIKLLLDMGKYKVFRENEGSIAKGRLIMNSHHFHLLEHCMLVDQFLANGVRYPNINNINLCENFTERILFILSVAALFHDLGKAGKADYEGEATAKNGTQYREKYSPGLDGMVYFQGKQPHEKIGAQYILHDLKDAATYPQYCMVEGSTLNFNILFGELQLTDTERKIVILLIWSHKHFPMVYNASLPEEKRDVPTITPENFFAEIQAMMDELGLDETALSHGNVSKKILLQMIIALTLADVLALYFELSEGNPSPVLGCFIPVHQRREFYCKEINGKLFDEYTEMIGHCQRIMARAKEWIPTLLNSEKCA